MSDQYTAYPGAGPYNAYAGNSASGTPMPPMPASRASVDPIISRLRPRDMVGILDQSFRLYRAHFLTFVAIIAVVQVPLQIAIQLLNVFALGRTASLGLSSSGSYSSASVNEAVTAQILAQGASLILTGLYSILLSLSQSGLTASVADSYLDRPVSF